MQANSSIFSIIKAYSLILRHYLHIHNLAIFQTLAYLEPVTYSKLCETLTRHIQNPAIVSQNSLFRHYSAILRTLHKACICRNLAYSESWNIENPSIIANQHIFRTLSYLLKKGKPCVTLEIQNLAILTMLEYSDACHI